MLRPIKERIAYSVGRIACPVLTALLLTFSFPNFNIWIFAWVGLVPLLFAIKDKSPRSAFAISYLSGVLFFLGTMYWLIHVTLPGMILVVLYLALYFGLFGLLASYAINNKQHSLLASRCSLLLLVPSIWVAMEFLRANILTGLPWALLGHSQSYNLPIIQIADMTGAYGVSFLIVMANAAIFLIIKDLPKKVDPLPLVIMSLAVLISLRYGYIRLNNIFTGEPLRVSVIQGSIPQNQKWDPGFREEILARYEALTRSCAKDDPDLIVWPETSVPGFLTSEPRLLARIRGLAADVKTSLLVGAVREDDLSKEIYYNSAILFSGEGRVIDRYDKIHLVPFGEYIPFKESLSFVEKFTEVPIGDVTMGREYTVFRFFIERRVEEKDSAWHLLKKARFSCLICFEDIFPEMARRFAAGGANFLVNITNDAWYKKSSAPFQHAQSSVFRAVENRINVIRAANTGYSCFIDQKGRIVADVDIDGERLDVAGFRTHDIILSRTRTIYNTYGDLFAYICAAIAIFSLGSMKWKIRKPEKR